MQLEAQAFRQSSRESLRPAPIAVRDNLRTVVRLLRAIDARSLGHVAGGSSEGKAESFGGKKERL